MAFLDNVSAKNKTFPNRFFADFDLKDSLPLFLYFHGNSTSPLFKSHKQLS
jgi:hypothetical protein